MTADEVRDFLTQRQIKFKESPVPHGIKFTCPSGEILIVYGTGKVNIQGKSTPLSAAVKEWYDTGSQAPAAQPAIKASPAAVAAGPDRRVLSIDAIDLLIQRRASRFTPRVGLTRG